MPIFGFRREAAIAEQQPRQAEASGHQLLESQRCRGKPAGEFGHEGDARGLNAATDFVGFVRFQVERCRAIDRLARVAGRENWQRTVPASREQEHRVNVVTRGECAEAIAGSSRPASGDIGGPVGNRIAERTHFEAIGQRAQGRGVAGFPRLTETDDTNAKFH